MCFRVLLSASCLSLFVVYALVFFKFYFGDFQVFFNLAVDTETLLPVFDVTFYISHFMVPGDSISVSHLITLYSLVKVFGFILCSRHNICIVTVLLSYYQSKETKQPLEVVTSDYLFTLNLILFMIFHLSCIRRIRGDVGYVMIYVLGEFVNHLSR